MRSFQAVALTALIALLAGCGGGGGGNSIPSTNTQGTVTTQSASGSPHFISSATSASIDTTSGDAGDLIANFKEAGLSNGQVETVTLSAEASVTYQCWNDGGQHPKAGNKTTINSSSSSTGNFTVQNGNITGSLTLEEPGPGTFSCPSGQTLYLESISWTNVALADTTSGATASIPGSFSATNLHTTSF